VTVEIENTENDELIEAMLHADHAPEPGDLKVQDIIHRPDGELPAAAVTGALESAGYVYIYDTLTGERSITNRNMLPAQLKKTREDGSRVFTTRKPKATPARGTYKCLLHPDVRKPEYDALGLPTCRKANLTSPLQVRLHMQHRHKSAWETIEEMRKEEERREELEFRRQVLEGSVKRKAS
jgi:hypothetical protein